MGMMFVFAIMQDYGIGRWAGFRQRLSYDCIYDYCIREKIELVYARCFMNANPWLIHFESESRSIVSPQALCSDGCNRYFL